MSQIFCDNLKNTIDAHLRFVKPEEMKALLHDHKLIITLSEYDKPIQIKLIKKRIYKKPPITLTQAEQQGIKQAKEILKTNTNAVYLYSLLAKLHVTLKSMDLNQLPEEGKVLLANQMEKLEHDIQKAEPIIDVETKLITKE